MVSPIAVSKADLDLIFIIIMLKEFLNNEEGNQRLSICPYLH
jgi:hypothetical protein